MLLAVLFKGRRTLCVASVTLSYKRFILTAVDYCDLAENFSAFVAEYQRFACFKTEIRLHFHQRIFRLVVLANYRER